MTAAPTVSVCIPSYNHERYLPSAIESVLAQTRRDFEIIVTDDGSTDGSLSVARAYASRYPDLVRVQTHANGRNLGISATVNAGLASSRGRFFCGLCSDDMFLPDKLERQVEAMGRHHDAKWVHGTAEIIDSRGESTGGRVGKDFTRFKDPVASLIEENSVCGISVMLDAAFMRESGPHAPGVYSDWEFWIRLALRSTPIFIAEPVVRYRLHQSNTSKGIAHQVNLTHTAEIFRYLFQEYVVRGQLSDHLKALVSLQLAWAAYGIKDVGTASVQIAHAFKTDLKLADREGFLGSWLARRMLLTERGSTFPGWFLVQVADIEDVATSSRVERSFRAESRRIAAIQAYWEGRSRCALGMTIGSWLADPAGMLDKDLLSIVFRTLSGTAKFPRQTPPHLGSVAAPPDL